MWDTTEKQFKKKMKALGASTETIGDSWKKVSKEIGSDKNAESAFKAMN
jgi:hypothetical protein